MDDYFKKRNEKIAVASQKAEAHTVRMASDSNKRQIGGSHYKTGGIEHWDVVHLFELDYFQGQITKYLFRWRKKNGIQDLEKARHFLDKYIELARQDEAASGAEALPRGYVDQDQGDSNAARPK
jgi:hypothetical protein